MKIVVTGASGHIGINLLPELLEAGYNIRLLSHRNEDVLKRFDVPVIRGDILDKASLVPLLDGADVVIHLAAIVTIQKKYPEAFRVNVRGTKNLLEISRKSGVRKFIYFSSIHSLDSSPAEQIMNEDRSYNSNSPFDYDRSKVIGEQMVLEANNENFETVILNPTSVVGPIDFKPSLMGRAIIQLYKGRIPALLRGGYNWIDVRDVVRSTLVAIEKSLPGEKFILGGEWHSMTELGEAVAKSGGKPCPRWLAPFWMAYLGAHLISMIPFVDREKQLFTSASLETLQYGHKNISSEKARKLLGHENRSFEITVADTVTWFRNNQMLD
jgi:dihydroflavonol-4-reductase